MTLRRIALAMTLFITQAAGASAALTFSTDHRALFFGVMQLDETKELAQSGSFHNDVTVVSDNGATWYLKIHVLRPLSSGDQDIPLENFQWQLDNTTGHGTVQRRHEFVPFRQTPDLVYLSGADEAAGTAVHFQFLYRLHVPETQPAGVYQTTVRFTLTEIL